MNMIATEFAPSSHKRPAQYYDRLDCTLCLSQPSSHLQVKSANWCSPSTTVWNSSWIFWELGLIAMQMPSCWFEAIEALLDIDESWNSVCIYTRMCPSCKSSFLCATRCWRGHPYHARLKPAFSLTGSETYPPFLCEHHNRWCPRWASLRIHRNLWDPVATSCALGEDSDLKFGQLSSRTGWCKQRILRVSNRNVGAYHWILI